jgi:hypothetical protein
MAGKKIGVVDCGFMGVSGFRMSGIRNLKIVVNGVSE